MEKPDRASTSLQTKVNQFYQAINRGEIAFTQCKKCGKTYLPPRADCSECYSSELEWKKLDKPTGKILTFTTIASPPESFEGRQPYTCAVVELENRLKALGWVEEVDLARLKIGMRVKLLPYEFEDGRLGFKIVESL